MSTNALCPNDECIPARSGGFCLSCGRSLNDQPAPIDVLVTSELLPRAGLSSDPDDPNYWVYLMHDLEIVTEPIEPQTSAGRA